MSCMDIKVPLFNKDQTINIFSRTQNCTFWIILTTVFILDASYSCVLVDVSFDFLQVHLIELGESVYQTQEFIWNFESNAILHS